MCTGITLKNKDGSVSSGRTMEWGTFDMKSRVALIPAGKTFFGNTPDGKHGKRWESRHPVVAVDLLERDGVLGDGLNAKGLTVGCFYHPGFATYAPYQPSKASSAIAPTDLVTFLLTQCSSVKEVRDALSEVRVVPVVDPELGVAAPIHLAVTDAKGKSIVVEFPDEEMRIFDNPLGVITNAPTFDWHITNLRNYVNLSPVAIPSKTIEDLEFSALGGGSGFIGMPGDFTPPSRFVRAVAFSQTARKTKDGAEGMYEVFRILDNFNVPLGAAEGSSHGANGAEHHVAATRGMRSATLWTTAYDRSRLVLYYHTQHNRRVRMVDLQAIDWKALGKDIVTRPLDVHPRQDIEDLTSAWSRSSTRTRRAA